MKITYKHFRVFAHLMVWAIIFKEILIIYRNWGNVPTENILLGAFFILVFSVVIFYIIETIRKMFHFYTPKELKKIDEERKKFEEIIKKWEEEDKEWEEELKKEKE